MMISYSLHEVMLCFFVIIVNHKILDHLQMYQILEAKVKQYVNVQNVKDFIFFHYFRAIEIHSDFLLHLFLESMN